MVTKRIVSPTRVGLVVGLLGVCGSAGRVQADLVSPEQIIYDRIFTSTEVPPPLPVINGTWLIPQYAGLPSELVCVTIELTTRVVYDGDLIADLADTPFELRVRSDFTLNFQGGAQPGSVTTMDPVVILTGTTPATPMTVFSAAATPTTNTVTAPVTTLTLAGDLAPYLGAGNVSVDVAGFLVLDPLAGFSNTDDQGDASATFVNDVKIFPIQGAQQYTLETTMRVIYFVPEVGASLSAMFGVGIGWFLLRRKAQVA